MTKYELIVLIYLLRFQNGKQITFPNYQEIAKYCAISSSKALKVVKSLTEKGILRKQTMPQSYRNNYSSLYVIVLKNGNGIPCKPSGELVE